MYMNINASTQERYIKQAQRKVLETKYAQMASTWIGGLVIMGVCFMLLTQVFGFEALTSLPISVYVPIAIFNLALFILRKTYGRDLKSYEVSFSTGKVTFVNLLKSQHDLPEHLEIDIDLIDSVFKIESGYIIHFSSKTLWKLNRDTQKKLRNFGLLNLGDDSISIFIPRMSFETYSQLKKFNSWLSTHNLLMAS